METDPNGLKPNDPGAKLDHGKIKAGLIQSFGKSLTEVMKLGTFGAIKYSRGGFLKVDNGQERYTDAMMRHFLKEPFEEKDPDSGVAHDVATAWNALARLEIRLRQEEGI